jgi:hypothetical protein
MRRYCAALFLFVLYAGAALSQEPEKDAPPRKLDPQEVEPLDEAFEHGRPPREVVRRDETPGVMASDPAGVAFLVVGVVGWIVLGLSVWVLERRAGRPSL